MIVDHLRTSQQTSRRKGGLLLPLPSESTNLIVGRRETGRGIAAVIVLIKSERGSRALTEIVGMHLNGAVTRREGQAAEMEVDALEMEETKDLLGMNAAWRKATIGLLQGLNTIVMGTH